MFAREQAELTSAAWGGKSTAKAARNGRDGRISADAFLAEMGMTIE